MKKRLIVHPVLFAVLPVLLLYSHNRGQLAIGEVFLPAALAAFASLLLWLALSRMLRDGVRAALVASLFWLWFFSYGHVLDALPRAPGIGALLPERHVLAVFYYGLLAVGVTVLVRHGRNWLAANSVVNLVAVVLVGVQVLMVGSYEVRRALADRGRPRAEVGDTARDGGGGVRPNIYYIVLDGYARADVLADLYDYDNAPFLDYLKEKGFFIARQGRANYCQTLPSVASCLNMDYLDEVAERVGAGSDDALPLAEMIADSAVARFLRERGYRTVAFASGYAGTQIRTADFYLGPVEGFSQFRTLLLNTTPLPAAFVSRTIFGRDRADFHRQRLLYAFRRLPETARLQPPIFVFAHIISPHPPFVFDRHGKPVALTEGFDFRDGSDFPGPREEYVRKYRDQVVFVNAQMRGLLDGLLQAAEHPTVIIVHADHGPGSRLDWTSAENSDLRERFATLSAYRFPGEGDAGLRDDISAVNVFRIVFNRYFDANLALLPDESYYSPGGLPYDFTRVTDAVNAKGAEPAAPQGGRE